MSNALGHQVRHFVKQHEHQSVFVDERKMRRLGFVTQADHNQFALVLGLGSAVGSQIVLHHIVRVETVDKPANRRIRHQALFRFVVIPNFDQILAEFRHQFGCLLLIRQILHLLLTTI